MDSPCTKPYLATPGVLLIDALIGTAIIGICTSMITFYLMSLSQTIGETHNNIQLLNYAISAIEQLNNSSQTRIPDTSITFTYQTVVSTYSWQGISPEFTTVTLTKGSKTINLISVL